MPTKWVLPLDMFLALERMPDRSLQAIGQCENLITRALTSRTAQDGHAAIVVEERGEAMDIGPVGIATARPGSRVSTPKDLPNVRLKFYIALRLCPANSELFGYSHQIG